MGTSEESVATQIERDVETGSGILVELVVNEPPHCPVAAVSAECNATAGSVCWCSTSDGNAQTVEFTLPSDATPSQLNADPVHSTGEMTRYQCTVADSEDCVRSIIEREVGPVIETRAERGALFFKFSAGDVDALRDTVAELRTAVGRVRVRSLTHSGRRLTGEDLITVDRGRLTDRQVEVLETAYEMGYYEHPKRANAKEVAARLDIAPTTLSEHLAAAQCKVLPELLDS